MGLAEAPLALSLAGLAAYAVLGGADFGAGLWFFLSGRGPGRRHLREHTFHAMGPVWEANHVWLIFVLVVCWTAYPVAFGSIASTLAVPLFIAAVGVIMRGTAYALRSGSPSRRQTARSGWSSRCRRCSPRSRSVWRSAGSRRAECPWATRRAASCRAGSTPPRS